LKIAQHGAAGDRKIGGHLRDRKPSFGLQDDQEFE
jgi:hypothetical protein